MTKVLHIINSLDQGGAEIMLAGLLEHSDRDKMQCEVISLTTLGPVAARVRKLGVLVRAIDLNLLNSPWALLKLFFLIWQSQPDVVQTWMYHSNLFGGLAAKLLTRAKIIWGIHASRLDPLNIKLGTFLTIRACSLVASWIPDSFICCSKSAQQFHELLGYDSAKIIYIPNGFDLRNFHPAPEAKGELTGELGLSDDTEIIGMIARYHPNKDHRNFLLAAKLLRDRVPNVHFVCCGKDVTLENPVLASCMEEFDLSDYCSLIGERSDIPRLAAAIDVMVSSSFIGEAFPLVLGEAMACGTPCVTTNVGDAAFIVGEKDMVVSPRDPEALARSLGDILSQSTAERRELRERVRSRILRNFNIIAISEQYTLQYEQASND